jgi:hypothetical protein
MRIGTVEDFPRKKPRSGLRRSEEAVEAAALGIEGGLGLARHFGHELEGRQVDERRFRGLNDGWNVMGEIGGHHQGGFGHRFLSGQQGNLSHKGSYALYS